MKPITNSFADADEAPGEAPPLLAVGVEGVQPVQSREVAPNAPAANKPRIT